MTTLFPPVKTPYFIVTPPYTHISSGVRTLHLLCHSLNSVGEQAFIAPTWDGVAPTLATLQTPLLTSYIVDFYKQRNIEPIAIYPDIVQGNPLNAKKVVRYLLAAAGLYGGDATFPPTDKIYGCATKIAKEHGGEPLVLPCSDRNIFHGPLVYIDGYSQPAREGTCFYSYKYDKIHGQSLLPITVGSTRLEGSLENIASILQKSKLCYVYEFSNIIIEAGLCGCPVVLVRTPYFHTLPGDDWHWPHVMWNDDMRSLRVEWALEVLKDYKAREELFWEQLKQFIRTTQEMTI